MSDLQAVYVHQYLDHFDSIVEKTTELYRYFQSIIPSSIRTFPNFSDGVPFVSCISVLVENSKTIMETLLENHIYCRKYYNPLIPTPNANEIYNQIVCISCTVDMTKEDIDRIVQLLLK
jgi:dTDP-4-amino-4,6-dideoxygalactose transaminase